MFKLLESGEVPFSWNTYGKYLLKYPPGVWVEAHPEAQANGYHILVFNTYHNARAYHTHRSEIWECDVTGEVELPPHLNPVSFRKHGFKAGPGDGWPHGTRMFKRIRLIRRVA